MNKIIPKTHRNSFLCTVVLLLLLGQVHGQINYEQELIVKEDGIGFLLSWSVSNESKNQSFYIERADGTGVFTTIGTVKSNGKKTESNYSFKDETLGLEHVSYRLKDVAKDGTSSCTRVVSLTKEFVSYFEVVHKEQITNEVFQVSINSITDAEINCRISNNMGEIILEEVKTLEIGLNDFVFDLSSEEDGTYHLIFKQKNVMETAMFKKQTTDKKGNVAKTGNENKGG